MQFRSEALLPAGECGPAVCQGETGRVAVDVRPIAGKSATLYKHGPYVIPSLLGAGLALQVASINMRRLGPTSRTDVQDS